MAAQQNVLSSRPFVHVVFARTQAGNNALDILLKNSGSGDAGPEWVLCGGEMLQEEMAGFHSKDKDIKHKTLMLAALRVAALDAGHCADMPETDFAAIGGAKKERLPPGLMSIKRMKSENLVGKPGAKTFINVCKLDVAVDGDYATAKWRPCSAVAAQQQQSDCKWFALADLVKATNRVPGLAPWVAPLLEKAVVPPTFQALFQPKAAARVQSTPQSPSARQNGGPTSDAAAAAVSQATSKPQGNMLLNTNMMMNTAGGYAPEAMPGPLVGGNAQQQNLPPAYAMPYPPQMDMAQQSSLKFKFPAHIISLVVRTTGPKLGRDKLVAIGAAFVKVPNHRTPVQILEKKTFQCEVDPNQPLDSNFMSAEELKQLQGEAKPTAQAVAQVVAFVKECMRQDHDSFIAAHNPMVELGMLELAAAEHCPDFITLSRLAEEAGGGNQGRAPIDLGSLACGLVSTDSKQGNGKPNMGRPRNGAPWATLSEYLQLENPGYDARPMSRPPVPRPRDANGRLDPHDEAVDKGWHFGNTLCILADKLSRAGMSMGMMGMANNPAMVQAFFQQQQMQMMHQQQQVWQQMQQMQLASAYQHQQQNYNAPHQQSHSPHHRLPPHTKQHRQYAGRGGGYHQNGMGMGIGLAPPVQPPQPQQHFSNARGTHDVPPAPKSVAGSADGISAQPPAADVAVIPGQATTNEGEKPTSDGGAAPLAVTAPPLAVPAVAAPQQLEPSAPAPAVVAAQQPLATSVPENSGEASGAASKESGKASESSGAESNAAAASNVASNAKQDAAPKSWAQMASKPPQNKPAPPDPVAAPAHSEAAGGAVTAAEGGKDAGRREAGADTAEQRPPGPRREHGRNEGPRKDSVPGGDRGGGRAKGNSVGGAGRGDGGGRPGGQQAGGQQTGRGMRAGNAN